MQMMHVAHVFDALCLYARQQLPYGSERVQVHWRIVKVSGDGDCLFHALAYSDGCDGQALRFEVASFMDARAAGEAGYEEEMRREAAKLRAGT